MIKKTTKYLVLEYYGQGCQNFCPYSVYCTTCIAQNVKVLHEEAKETCIAQEGEAKKGGMREEAPAFLSVLPIKIKTNDPEI